MTTTTMTCGEMLAVIQPHDDEQHKVLIVGPETCWERLVPKRRAAAYAWTQISFAKPNDKHKS